jgi:hypothetical protein
VPVKKEEIPQPKPEVVEERKSIFKDEAPKKL